MTFAATTAPFTPASVPWQADVAQLCQGTLAAAVVTLNPTVGAM